MWKELATAGIISAEEISKAIHGGDPVTAEAIKRANEAAREHAIVYEQDTAEKQGQENQEIVIRQINSFASEVKEQLQKQPAVEIFSYPFVLESGNDLSQPEVFSELVANKDFMAMYTRLWNASVGTPDLQTIYVSQPAENGLNLALLRGRLETQPDGAVHINGPVYFLDRDGSVQVTPVPEGDSMGVSVEEDGVFGLIYWNQERGTWQNVTGFNADGATTESIEGELVMPDFYRIPLPSGQVAEIPPTPIPSTPEPTQTPSVIALVGYEADTSLPAPANEYSLQFEDGTRTVRSTDPSLVIRSWDRERFLQDLANLKVETDGNVVVEFRDIDTYNGQATRMSWKDQNSQPAEYYTVPEVGPNGERILPIYIKIPEIYESAAHSDSFACPGQEIDMLTTQLYNRFLSALYLDQFPGQGGNILNVNSVVYKKTGTRELVPNTTNCGEMIEWRSPREAITFDVVSPSS